MTSELQHHQQVCGTAYSGTLIYTLNKVAMKKLIIADGQMEKGLKHKLWKGGISAPDSVIGEAYDFISVLRKRD